MFQGFNESTIVYYKRNEENLSAVFYEREILNYVFSAFDSVREVYFMLKEALWLTP